jgi:hypothetical protein
MTNRLAGTAGGGRLTPDARSANDKIAALTSADKLPRQRACFWHDESPLIPSRNTGQV